MAPFLLLLLLAAFAHVRGDSLQRTGELIYVDFRADPTPQKVRDCMTGSNVESTAGLHVLPNTPLAIDLSRLSLFYGYDGTSLAVMFEYFSETALHPSLQFGSVMHGEYNKRVV